MVPRRPRRRGRDYTDPDTFSTENFPSSSICLAAAQRAGLPHFRQIRYKYFTMPKTKEQYLTQITGSGVVAVIRAKSKDQLMDIAKALLAGGVPAIEVTMSTPKAIAGIEMLADALGDQAVVGVGTVIDASTCRDAISAGAQFVVSPTFDAEIVATTKRHGKISIPGSFTPTEILRSWSAGADVVKVFPSTSLGPGYFKDLLAPLPQLNLTPTGGVD